MAGPIVSYVSNPYPTFPGRPHRGFPDCGCLDPFKCELHINVLELKAVILALKHWVAVLQGHHVLIATDNTTVVPFPPVAAGGRSVSVATNLII